MCMGWIFMRAGPPVLRLFEPFLAKIVELRDDQRALNYVLAHRTHLAWDRDPCVAARPRRCCCYCC